MASSRDAEELLVEWCLRLGGRACAGQIDIIHVFVRYYSSPGEVKEKALS